MLRFATVLPIIVGLSVVVSAQSLTTVRVARGMNRVVWIGAPPGDHDRLFAIENHSGRIRVIENGVLLAQPFLHVNDEISTDGEDGLMSMAFHPDFANNGRVFVLSTDLVGDSVLAEYTVDASNPNLLDESTKQILFGPVFQPSVLHNMDCLQFGPDGKLYLSAGDGGPTNDPDGRGQDLSSPLGKLLRLDVDIPFPHVPADNPFVGDPLAHDLIWAYGVRQPWRFSFDRETGDLYLGDVGEGNQEEIDFQPAGSAGGENYGWRCIEGSFCTGLSGCACGDVSLTPPIHEYSHAGRCAIIGGHVYRGAAMPALHGTYFFADFCSSEIWSFRYTAGTVTEFTDRTTELAPSGGLTIGTISSFGEDAAGEIYICDLFGEVYKIVPAEDTPGVQLCSGDGSDRNGCTSCPCTNDVPDGTKSGCTNSSGVGATLSATGTAYVGADTLQFDLTGATPSSFGILLAGINALPANGICPPGSGILGQRPLDGLRCIGGGLVRHGARGTDQNGASTSSWGGPGPPMAGLIAQGGYAVGETRIFQVFYRETAMLVCGTGQNTSDARRVVILP